MAEQSLSKIQELETGEDSNPDEQMPKYIPCAATSYGVGNVYGPKFDYINKISLSNSTDQSRLITTDGSSNDPLITSKQYLNILQSMGQSLHIFDHNGLVIYWNQKAEHLYGYSASEVLGRHINDIMLEECDTVAENEIIRRNNSGESWTGVFPGRNKEGRLSQIYATNTPFYDDRGTLVGILCVSSDSLPFRENVVPISFSDSLPFRENVVPISFGNETSDSLSSYSFDSETTTIMGSGGTTTSRRSSSSSSSSRLGFYVEADSSTYDISWEDLTFGKKIGRGTCATVYHGLWCGSDVAIKVFFNSDYSEDLQHSFREEVLLMKRLRHPNVVLFMGEVTSLQHRCIVTEFLPRGSLFQLLRHRTPTLKWERRVQMALDIALGMNYLHCHSPPIVHRDLKSSNLLVDKNWTVKVGDFGLSRLKNESFLTTKKGEGTPQWMAPEVFHNEPVDEKSDVYSFGVVLWELVTLKIPWDGLNQMQVVAAVGFMDQRMEIPNGTDPHWASLIESSWKSDPKCRPTFKELVKRLKDLQRHYFDSKRKRIPC